ncbi:hypothetical protein ACHAXT_002661 [Thalassiosira profunda]
MAPGGHARCLGIQHGKLNSFALDNSNHAYCYERWSNFQGWRAKNCGFMVPTDDLDRHSRCKRCRNAYNNIRPTRNAELFPNAAASEAENATETSGSSAVENGEGEAGSIVDLVLPDEAALREQILRRVDLLEEDAIPGDAELSIAAKALVVKGLDLFRLDEQRVFAVCGGCGAHCVKKDRANVGSTCRRCIERKSDANRYARRKEAHKEMRVATDSSVAMCHLDDEERKTRTQNNKVQRKKLSQKLERALARLDRSVRRCVMTEEMLKHAEAAMEAMANEPEVQERIEDRIYKMVKQLEADGNYDKGEVITRDNCRQLVEQLAERAKNWVHVKRDRKAAIEFSELHLGVAMSDYCSRPGRYKQMRGDSVFIEPSPGYLKKLKNSQKVTHGPCMELLIPQPTYRGTGEVEEWGQLGCDEMKLSEHGVLTNTFSDDMSGITRDFTDIGRIVHNLLDDDVIEQRDKPAVYVNQFCYRSTSGRIYNVMCFYNSGSLPANVALQQLILCIIGCETVGSRIFGFICDAGGSMQSLMRYLRDKARLPEGPWLPLSCVRFINPFDPTRWIYLYHCSTHNLKNGRGMFFQSKPLGGKNLLDTEGNFIGKYVLEMAFQRDEERRDRGAAPLTRLTAATINLNKWSKMSASEAKKAAEPRTLQELGGHIAGLLQLTIGELYRVEDHPTGQLGYFSALARHFMGMQKRKDPSNLNLASQIASFEFLANLSEIYNQLFLNMKQLIRWNNIELLEAQLIRNLQYFDGLRQAALRRGKDGENTFIAKETWDIMRVSARGFMAYTRCLLDLAMRTAALAPHLLPKNVYAKFAISPSHTNSSHIESHFSGVRQNGMADAFKYCCYIANNLMTDGVAALSNNDAYDAEDIGVVRTGEDLGPRALKKLHEARRKIRDTSITVYQQKKESYNASVAAFSALVAVLSNEQSGASLCPVALAQNAEMQSGNAVVARGKRGGTVATITPPDGALLGRAITVTKAAKETLLGLTVANDFARVNVISPKSLFAETELEVGMFVESVGGQRCLSGKQCVEMLKSAVGRVTITATTNSSAIGASASTDLFGADESPAGPQLIRGGGESTFAEDGTPSGVLGTAGLGAPAVNGDAAVRPRGDEAPAAKAAVRNPYANTKANENYAKGLELHRARKAAAEADAKAAESMNAQDEDDLPPPRIVAPEEMIESIVKSVQSKRLKDGYASYLMENDLFRQFIHVSYDSEVWPWFQSFLEDTLRPEISLQFDDACRAIMDRLFEFSKDTLYNRKNRLADSWEYRWYQLLISEEFAEICWTRLPTDAMKHTGAAWPMLAFVLADILRKWIVDATRSARARVNPELFARDTKIDLSDEELNSETNRFIGWAIKSCIDKRRKTDPALYQNDECYQLLASMVCYEKDVSDDYIAERYDMNMLVRNAGSEGGLTLVKSQFFEWGRSVIRTIAKEHTVHDIKANPHTAAKAAANRLLNNASLRSQLALAASKHSSASYRTAMAVYVEVMTKVKNARFGVVTDSYKKSEVTAKGAANFRTELLVMSRHPRTQDKKPAAIASSAPSLTGAPTDAVLGVAPTVAIVLPPPGQHGAIANAKLLKGKAFVLTGLFVEVSSDEATAIDAVKKALASFGAKTTDRFSKNTTHLLAGKFTKSAKIGEAGKRNVEVINLHRVQKLLLGELTLETLREQPQLSKDAFKDDTYREARVLAMETPRNEATSEVPSGEVPSRSEARQIEPLRDEPLRDEPLRDEPMRDEPMRDEMPSGNEARQGEARQIEPRQIEVPRNEPMRDEPSQEAMANLVRRLTPEQQQRVDEALRGNGTPADVLVLHGRGRVTRESMETLRPGQWLNDEALNFYLTVCLKVRDERLCREQPGRRRSHFYSSFFMQMLFDEKNNDTSKRGVYSYANVKKWSDNAPGGDIFALKYIVCPINLDNLHWTSAVIFMEQKRIQYYDSMGGTIDAKLLGLMQYLRDEHKEKKESELDISEWRLVRCTSDTPQQRNGFDCGVFTCLFADFISKDCPLVFSQEDVDDHCRERIALSILSSRAIGESERGQIVPTRMEAV